MRVGVWLLRVNTAKSRGGLRGCGARAWYAADCCTAAPYNVAGLWCGVTGLVVMRWLSAVERSMRGRREYLWGDFETPVVRLLLQRVDEHTAALSCD